MGAEEDVWAWEGGINGRLERITKRGASWFLLLTEYYPGDQIKVYEVGGQIVTHGGEKK